jgi:hypothetical protein
MFATRKNRALLSSAASTCLPVSTMAEVDQPIRSTYSITFSAAISRAFGNTAIVAAAR